MWASGCEGVRNGLALTGTGCRRGVHSNKALREKEIGKTAFSLDTVIFFSAPARQCIGFAVALARHVCWRVRDHTSP